MVQIEDIDSAVSVKRRKNSLSGLIFIVLAYHQKDKQEFFCYYSQSFHSHAQKQPAKLSADATAVHSLMHANYNSYFYACRICTAPLSV